MAGTLSQCLIVDTDILIDLARREPQALDYLNEQQNDSSLAISVVTEMELVVGCRNKTELGNLDALLKHFRTIQINADVSKTATSLMREYRLSHGLLIPDALIAATAIVCETAMATKNQKDYRYIKDLLLRPYPQY